MELKTTMLNGILSKTNSNKTNHDFKDIVNELKKLSIEQNREIKISTIFLTLLHIINEKNFKIEQKGGRTKIFTE